MDIFDKDKQKEFANAFKEHNSFKCITYDSDIVSLKFDRIFTIINKQRVIDNRSFVKQNFQVSETNPTYNYIDFDINKDDNSIIIHYDLKLFIDWMKVYTVDTFLIMIFTNTFPLFDKLMKEKI